MHDFKAHFPEGVPSMKRATSLTIKGDYLFEGDAVINGDVHLINETGEQRVIKKGQVL
jgi:UTP--glucose-1-phosphate uridylyltransferase